MIIYMFKLSGAFGNAQTKPFRRQGEGFASFGSGLARFRRFKTAFSSTGSAKRQSQTAGLASRNCLFLDRQGGTVNANTPAEDSQRLPSKR